MHPLNWCFRSMTVLSKIVRGYRSAFHKNKINTLKVSNISIDILCVNDSRETTQDG